MVGYSMSVLAKPRIRKRVRHSTSRSDRGSSIWSEAVTDEKQIMILRKYAPIALQIHRSFSQKNPAEKSAGFSQPSGRVVLPALMREQGLADRGGSGLLRVLEHRDRSFGYLEILFAGLRSYSDAADGDAVNGDRQSALEIDEAA